MQHKQITIGPIRITQLIPREFSGVTEVKFNTPIISLRMFWCNRLSGPLRLRVQSRSRTRLRIAASIAFLFRACFKDVLDTIAPLSRG